MANSHSPQVRPSIASNANPQSVSQGTMGDHQCTGALITTWPVPMIVTAAHCNEDDVYTVFANRYDSALSTASESGLEFTVEKIVDHPEYNDVTDFNDIAVWVLKLKSNPSNLDLQMFPTIAINTNPSLPTPGSLINIAGWGRTSFNEPASPHLLGATVPSISSDDCVRLYGSKVWPPGQMCTLFTGTTPTGVCSGDSGSSEFMKINGKDTMMGIANWVSRLGSPCAAPDKPAYPDVAARASYYYSWIVSTVLANGGAMPGNGTPQLGDKCCPGCSYKNSCCCPPDVTKTVRKTVQRARGTMTVTRKVKQVPRDSDISGQHLCPTCKGRTGSGKVCCKPVATRKVTKTVTKFAKVVKTVTV
jgi:hypothetical protein